MIQLNATINVLDALGEQLVSTSTTSSKSNVSADISDLVGHKNKYENPFILGSNKCGDGSFLYDKVKYFIGGEASNENGDFANSYVFLLNGTNLTHFTMEFDKLNNAYPTSIIVDGTTYANDDTTFTVANLASTTSITVKISNWSLPNRPLIVQSIFVGLTIDIDYKNAIEISSELKSSSDNSQPTFGLLSNVGNIRFNDIGGEVKDYAEMQLLKSGCKVEIFLKNSLTNQTQIVGRYNTEEWNYDNDEVSVSVSLTDKLIALQDVIVPPLATQVDITAYDYWLYVIAYIPQGFSINISESKINALKNIKIGKMCADGKSVWSSINNICNAALMHCFLDKNGDICLI